MAVVSDLKVKMTGSGNHGHSQLTRSLERILEDANFSGELRLSGRKLKDFPKIAGQYSLGDCTFADFSRNRFGELPEEVTEFYFLETLLFYHNAMRTIPESVRSLCSLSFLDLRNNQLTTLPRELCLLPIKILLVSNNRLIQLPEELSRMDKLTELDVSCNQISHLPNRLIELRQLRSLNLRHNLLVYIPRELTSLQLVTLDVSYNRIGKLPVELRKMESLVNLELENNPLTSPPASLCVRGLVHVYKYLETVALKEEKKGGSASMDSSLRRNTSNPTSSLKLNGNSVNLLLENQRGGKKLESSTSMSCESVDKRWSSQDDHMSPKWSPMHSKSGSDTPNGTLSGDLSPVEEKLANLNGSKLSNVQTYREYKEALKQQRSQDSSSIYRSKDNTSSSSSSSNQNSPMSPVNGNGKKEGFDDIIINKSQGVQSSKSRVLASKINNKNFLIKEDELDNSNSMNGNGNGEGYIKPNSPVIGGQENLINNNGDSATDSIVIRSIMNGGSLKNTGKEREVDNKTGGGKTPGKRTVSWNRDITEKNLSFTMRREFDRHKEEAELIGKLRNILESRLKMTLPEDMAPALADGVVLCHLANNVRPRSVASIHVPSSAVPKLTMARCRRNVDNFLDACRKIGVDDECLCSCEDILSLHHNKDDQEGYEEEDGFDEGLTTEEDLRRMATLKSLTGAVMSLIECGNRAMVTRSPKSRRLDSAPATTTNKNNNLLNNNTNFSRKNNESIVKSDKIEKEEVEESLDEKFQDENNYENYVNYFKNRGILFPRSALYAENTCYDKNVLNEKKNISNNQRQDLKLNLNFTSKNNRLDKKVNNNQLDLIGIAEECEYDSDIGKFNCNNLKNINIEKDLNEENGVSNQEVKNVNDLTTNNKMITKKIAYFENKVKPNGIGETTKTPEKTELNGKVEKTAIDLPTYLCLGTFFMTIILLFLFPLPN